jgi:hypothetical protein
LDFLEDLAIAEDDKRGESGDLVGGSNVLVGVGIDLDEFDKLEALERLRQLLVDRGNLLARTAPVGVDCEGLQLVNCRQAHGTVLQLGRGVAGQRFGERKRRHLQSATTMEVFLSKSFSCEADDILTVLDILTEGDGDL